MSKSLNHFKTYKIEYDDEFYDKVINYYGGGDFDYSYGSIAKIGTILGFFNVYIPIYDYLNPPENEKLELISSNIISYTIDKALKLLNENSNPIIDGEKLFDGKIKSIDEDREGLIDTLKKLKILSDKGFFLVWDSD
ncbi:hypothetical protein FDB39_16995 [Clostridium botulinum]|nr:hypothetical protein [Clostridium botulinum]